MNNKIIELKADTALKELELTIPEIRKLSKDQKAFIKGNFKVAILSGYMNGLEFALYKN